MFKSLIEFFAQKKGLKAARNQKGFSLIELIVVIALVGVMLGVAGILVVKGRSVSKEGENHQKIGMVINALNERKMYASTLPTQAAAAAMSGIASLTPYVPSDLQTWQYQCVAGGNAIVTIPGYESNANAIAARQKLVDNGTCDATTAAPGATSVACVIKQFVGNSGC